MRLRLFPTLLALFIGLPLVDLVVIALLGSHIGFWQTVALLIISGFAGAALAKSQTRSVWSAIQHDLSQGRVPSQGLMDAALVFVAGGMLMSPGFVSDILGLALLVPAVRTPIKALLRRQVERMIANSAASVWTARTSGGWVREVEPGTVILEGQNGAKH